MERRNAARQILSFMWALAKRYNAGELSNLWIAMDEMRQMFGDIFVADTIIKSPAEAELALLRKEVTA